MTGQYILKNMVFIAVGFVMMGYGSEHSVLALSLRASL
jgi:hypothetical protein